MPRLLVTGASGFLGWNVCREAVFQGNWEVYGAYFSHAFSIDGVKTVRIDVQDPEATRVALQTIQPSAVVHCAALPDPNACEKDPEKSHALNVDASVALAKICADMGIDCSFTSTDLVFDGEHAPYGETDALGPLNVYGVHKAEAEKAMRRVHPGVVICRMPLMFGDVGPWSKSFIQPLMQQMSEKKEIRLFTDEFRTPVSGRTASRGLLLTIGKTGETFHLGGAFRLSRFEMGTLLCEACGADVSLVKPALQKEFTAPAKRARDASLRSEKAFALGYAPLPVAGQLGELACVADFKKQQRQNAR